MERIQMGIRRALNSMAIQLFSLAVAFFFFSDCLAQSLISGQITDAETGAALGGVTVILTPSGQSTATDSTGRYTLRTARTDRQIEFRTLGYKTAYQSVSKEGRQTIDMQLEQENHTLDAIVIQEKGRYRNKDNPAVALMRKVIEQKPANSPMRFAYQSYDTYEKTLIALSDLPKVLRRNWLTKGYRFLFENIDSTLVPGYHLLPAYLDETLSTQYKRQSPRASERHIRARKMTELDPRYINNQHIQTYLNFLQDEIRLYDKEIMIANKAFLSPIADIAPLFYRYYITDTLHRNQKAFVELAFVPRNSKNYLFTGKLEIDLSNYSVGAAVMEVDRKANLNWLKSLTISLTFEPHADVGFLPSKTDFRILAGLPVGKTGVYLQRTQVFQGYRIAAEAPDGVFTGHAVRNKTTALRDTAAYWQNHRPLPLRPAELRAYQNMDRLRHNESFRRTLSWASFLSDGFVHAGPVDIGPVEYAYSYNALEGSRIRLGGRSSQQAWQRGYLEGYVAYGLGDEQFKYYVNAAQSLNERPIAVFPAHYLQVSYQQDVRQPGQKMGFLNGDSFFQSFRTDDHERYLFKKALTLRHTLEFENHVSLTTHIGRLEQQAAYNLLFVNARPLPDTLHHISSGEIGVNLRWAPHEQIIQERLERTSLPNPYPIFNLQYTQGIKGFLGSQYDYQILRAAVSKRMYIAPFGVADMQLSAGYIWGTLPYLLLDIPNANQTYIISPDAYHLMRDLEFVNDRFIKFDVQHQFQGFILNKIPLIRRLKWRERLGFKMLYGGLRPENNPAYNVRALRFPTDKEGRASTFAISEIPYMEFSAGIENIFKVLQVQYIRRLTYLDHRDIDRDGFRFSIKLDF